MGNEIKNKTIIEVDATLIPTLFASFPALIEEKKKETDGEKK